MSLPIYRDRGGLWSELSFWHSHLEIIPNDIDTWIYYMNQDGIDMQSYYTTEEGNYRSTLFNITEGMHSYQLYSTNGIFRGLFSMYTPSDYMSLFLP